MAVQNIDLYRFMNSQECHLFREGEEIKACVIIDFCDLKDFVETVGIYPFDDGGMDVKMFDSYIAIDLEYIFEAEGEFLYEYRDCFEDEEFEKYKDELFNTFQRSH